MEGDGDRFLWVHFVTAVLTRWESSCGSFGLFLVVGVVNRVDWRFESLFSNGLLSENF